MAVGKSAEMNKTRKQNLILNLGFGYIAQIGIILMSFIGRKVFLHYLSVDYLGINGLYSNILTILSLPELGLDSSVVYFLYKPVAKNEKHEISLLMKYFKKLYTILAIAVFIAGIALIPFLKYIIKTDLAASELIIYYVLFLINTSVSYLAAHKVALLSAHQEQRIQKLVMLGTNIFLQIIHIVILAIWKNYYLYLVGTISATVLNAVILTIWCNRLHPVEYSSEQVPNENKLAIKTKIASTFVYKIGTVAINNTDNILMSVIVNVAAVGLYSNYYTIIAAVQGLLGIVNTSLISSIGNMGALKENDKQYGLFNVMILFYHFIGAVGGVGFYLLMNDFIVLWLGKEYLFDSLTVFAIAFNFYLTTLVNPIWMFREANGLFEKVKYTMLITATINLILSVVLGKIWGVFGILIATAISKISTYVWYEPMILFKHVFNKSAINCLIKEAKYILLTVTTFVLANLAISPFVNMNNVFVFAVKMAIIAFICGFVFLAGTYKTNEIKTIKSLLRRKTKNVSFQK